ncbi:MAG: dihydrolipoyl dehydrogenase [Desulfuromonadaceae bacterium]
MSTNMSVEVAIIGAGSAGLTAQREVARQTDSYVVLDPGPLGTTCARTGCMPSKVLIHMANTYHQIMHSPPGLNSGASPGIDSAEIMKHVRALRDDFVSGVLKGMQSWEKTHFIKKRARFLAPNVLDLEGQRLNADTIIIATGSEPVIPEPWQKFTSHLLDTDKFFDLAELPERLAVIGLGSIGLEMGQALHRLGVDITGIDPGRGIGGLTDPEVQEYAVEHFSREMSLMFAPADIQDASETHASIKVGDESIDVTQALISVGRQPAVQGLGLENLDVTLDDKGLPGFDQSTLKLHDLPIFMAGDANGVRPLLHEAVDEGRIAGFNATRSSPECFIRRTPLAITFTSPAVAIAGSTFQELREQKRDFVVGSADFEHQGRARIMHAAHGMLRIYADRNNGRLLGAELFAPGGEHLAHLFAWSITMQMTISDLLNMPFYHPVLEEGMRSAIRDADKQLEFPASYTQTMRCDSNPVE